VYEALTETAQAPCPPKGEKEAAMFDIAFIVFESGAKVKTIFKKTKIFTILFFFNAEGRCEDVKM
jgi:hypothetical protein